MSLRINSYILSFLFLLTLVSCEKPSDIGLGLQGENNLLGTTFEKMNVVAGTIVQPDSIVAFKNNPILVGKATDGEFGTITAGHYTEIGLNSTSASVTFDVAPGKQADSMVLVLAYNGYYYGDTTANLTVNVLRLDENFKDDNTYFTNTTIAGSRILGSKTFKPRYNRTKINGKAGSRLLRIKLNAPEGIALANELIAKSGQNDLTTQTAFRDFWKGIAIVPDASAPSGSIVGFTIPDTAGVQLRNVAGINLYYTDKNNQLKSHNFSLSGSYYYNSVKASGPGKLPALAKGQELKSTDSNNEVYFQENTGVKTFITLPEIATFKNGKGNIYINHAELVIPVKAGTTNPGGGKVTKAPEGIIFYESTKGKRVAKTALGVSYTVQRGDASAFGISRPARALYMADSGFYKVNITSHIQALLDGKKTNNGIIVSPMAEDAFTATASGLAFPGTVTANRAIIDATPGKIKLRIYYTQIK